MEKSNTIYLGVFLAVICAVASGILAVTNKLTQPDIEKMKMLKTTEALKTVLPPFDNAPSEEAATIKEPAEVIFYPAKKDGKLVGIAAKSFSMKGYGGKITVMSGMEPDGKIGTVIVIENNETPGLGTNATDRKRVKTISEILSGKKDESLPPNQVLDSFRDKNASSAPWKLKKNGGTIDSVTGATISSLAVTDAVNAAAEAFEKNKTMLIEKFTKP